MLSVYQHLIFVFLYKFLLVSSSIHEKNLRQYLHSLYEGYTPDIRPVINHSLPITVKFSVAVQQITLLNEREQFMETVLWRDLLWIDNIHKWNPNKYGGIQNIAIKADQIWTPDVVLHNK